MAEAVRRTHKLNRNLRDFGPVEISSIFKDIIDDRLADKERQKLVHNHPLVVPRREPAGFAEQVLR